MDKPLGYKTYIKGNRWQAVRYMFCISLCMVILGMTKIILNAEQMEIGCSQERYHHFMLIQNELDRPIPIETIVKIRQLKGVEGVYPVKVAVSDFFVLFSSLDQVTYYIEEEGAQKMAQSMDPNLDLAHFPKQDSGGEVISSRVLAKDQALRNRVEEEPDCISLHTDIPFLIIPETVEEPSESYVILAEKEDQLAVIKQLKGLLSQEVMVKSSVENLREDTFNSASMEESFGLILMIMTGVMSVTAGILTYVHYTGRRKEMGLLNAIGYSQKWLIARLTKEMLLSTLAAMAAAGILLYLGIVGCNAFINRPNGYELFTMDGSVVWVLMSVPMFMMFFSMLPIWIMLRTSGQITIVERGY